MTPNTERALQALDEAIPPHLRSNRHGEGFLGERYETLRAFILATLPSGIEADGDGGKGLIDRGPWRAEKWPGGDVVIQSEEFTHDVALIVNGDFANGTQRMAYAKGLAAQFNAGVALLSPTSPPNGKTEGDADV